MDYTSITVNVNFNIQQIPRDRRICTFDLSNLSQEQKEKAIQLLQNFHSVRGY